MLLPIDDRPQWQTLSYKNIPANQVRFADNALIIQVDGSASPLIYPFSQPLRADSIAMRLSVDGYLNLDGQKQGESGADDFVFRLGVVYRGDKRLSTWQHVFAPEWVKTLFRLAPEDTGIDYIGFFNVYSDDRLAARQRSHPSSNLIIEQFVSKRSDDPMLLQFYPNKEQDILALWISSDGDDTDSSYLINLSDLQVNIR